MKARNESSALGLQQDESERGRRECRIGQRLLQKREVEFERVLSQSQPTFSRPLSVWRLHSNGLN